MSFSESYQRLKQAQKTARGAPLYSLIINRPLGRILAASANSMGLRPDQVTIISALFTLSGIVAIGWLRPTPLMALGVTFVLVLGYALDAADGQLARLQGGGSLTGEWLDHLVDAFKIASLHLAVLVMMYRWFDVGAVWLAVPIIFSVAYVVHFFGMLLTDLLARVAKAGRPQSVSPDSGATSSLMSMAKLPTDYGIFCLAFLTLVDHTLFLWVYLVLAAAMVGYTAMVIPVWYRRLRRLDRELRETVA